MNSKEKDEYITQSKNTNHIYQQYLLLQELIINLDKKYHQENQGSVKIQKVCGNIFQIYPKLKNSIAEDFGKSLTFASMLLFGEIQLYKNEQQVISFPRLIPFPIIAPVLFNTKRHSQQWLENFLFRMFQTVPLQYLEIIAIDPASWGKTLADFNLFLQAKRPFIYPKILTQSDEIETILKKLKNYAENLIQKKFIGDINNWTDYNSQNSKEKLPYKLLIINGLQEQFTENSIFYLTQLIGHGPECGILPLILLDRDAIKERKFELLRTCLSEKCWEVDKIFSYSSLAESIKNLDIKEVPESIIAEKNRRSVIDFLITKFAAVEKNSQDFKDLIQSQSFWKEKSSDSISTITGWQIEGNTPVSFKLGDPPNPAHVLLGGKTGSGKSNFLHVLIGSLCAKYSPEELQLYLLDYKEGTEFHFYANPVLPHARLIATQSDIDYGLTVLRHLKEEHLRRSELFKQTSVSTYKDYRNKTGNILPRVLIIIDEFQRLFETSMKDSFEIEELLNGLLRQGRSSGLHLLLATQTIHGLKNQSRSQLLSNLAGRIALSSTLEDSALILGGNNFEAAELNSPPEAILNNNNGIKSANIRFAIPLANSEYRLRLLSKLNLAASESLFLLKNTVFRGDQLPGIPSTETFKKSCSTRGLPIFLGKEYNFLENNFIVDVEKENLLIAGFDPKLRQGILHSILYSLKSSPQAPEILYLNSISEKLFSSEEQIENSIHEAYSLNASDIENFMAGEGKKVIIINSFDYAEEFHSKPQFRIGKNSQESKNPYELLIDLLSSNKRELNAHIFLFIEDYERYFIDFKDLFEHFNLRIGFCMNEDLAGRFIRSGSGYGKFAGIADSKKALFVNRKANEHILFRPFI